MERKSSINIQKTTTREFYHNSREHKTNNSIFDKSDNYCNISGAEAKKAFETYLEQAEKRYKEKTGQRLQKNVNKLYSAVINLNETHKSEDVWKVAKHLEETLGTKVLQVSIHRDEGHIDKKTGEKHINYHAHIVFSGIDENGYSVGKKLNRTYLRNLQTEVANILQMERGLRGSQKKRLNWKEYKEYKKREEKTINKKLNNINLINKQLEIENKLLQAKIKKQQNTIKNLQKELRETSLFAEYAQLDIEQLQDKNKNLIISVSNLKEEISELRKKMIKINKNSTEQIFNQEDYKYLSKLKRELKKNNLKEIYQEIQKIKNKIKKENKKEKIENDINF